MSLFNSARRMLDKAQHYARQNPDKVSRFTDKAARFADERTHGKYRRQIDTAVHKVHRTIGGHGHRDERGHGPRG